MRRLFPPEEARELPDAPLSPYPNLTLPDPPPDRPFVYVNMAMTLDGRVVTGNPKAGFLLSGSEGDRRGMAELRALADGVMVGAGTLRAEDPLLHIAYEDLTAMRRAAGLPETPRYLVATASGNLNPAARAFRQPGALVVTSETGAAHLDPAILAHTDVVAAGHETLDLEDALRQLRDDYGIRYLLVEGGPGLTHSFVAAGLVDELFVTVAPLLKAGDAIPTLLEGPAFAYSALPRLRLLSVTEHEGELYLRYQALKDATPAV